MSPAHRRIAAVIFAAALAGPAAAERFAVHSRELTPAADAPDTDERFRLRASLRRAETSAPPTAALELRAKLASVETAGVCGSDGIFANGFE
jgi:hypothetical protein